MPRQPSRAQQLLGDLAPKLVRLTGDVEWTETAGGWIAHDDTYVVDGEQFVDSASVRDAMAGD